VLPVEALWDGRGPAIAAQSERERDPNVCLNPFLDMVANRRQLQVTLERFESRLALGSSDFTLLWE